MALLFSYNSENNLKQPVLQIALTAEHITQFQLLLNRALNTLPDKPDWAQSIADMLNGTLPK